MDHTDRPDQRSDNDRGEDVYSPLDQDTPLPRLRFPDGERNPGRVHAAIHDELMLDGNARQNLATFCQTWEEPEVHALMEECMDKNMVDKDDYPQSAEIENRCVRMLADLARRPCWVGWR